MKRSDQLRQWGRRSEAAHRLGAISKLAAPYLTIMVDEFDADPFKINVQNCTLVARRVPGDGDPISFKSYDPADFITKLMPVDYDPTAQCPVYDRFLAEVQPDPGIRRFLHQWGGLSLTGDVSEQKLVFNWGMGRNGKSTLVECWAHILGDYGQSVPIETFVNEGRARSAGQATPDLAMLKGARFVYTDEPDRGCKLSEGLVKLVTGGDTMKVRELHRPYYSLRPEFKLMMSGNHRPRIQGGDRTHGIWRRVVLVPWRVTIPEDKIDKNLPEKLWAEASGILNRLLDGLRDWLDHGLVVPQEVRDATESYRSDSDPLGRFISECTEPGGPEDRVQASVFHRLFGAWARANGEREWTAKGLGTAMRERGFQSLHSNVNYWCGFKLTRSLEDFANFGSKSESGAESENKAGVQTLEDDIVPL